MATYEYRGNAMLRMDNVQDYEHDLIREDMEDLWDDSHPLVFDHRGVVKFDIEGNFPEFDDKFRDFVAKWGNKMEWIIIDRYSDDNRGTALRYDVLQGRATISQGFMTFDDKSFL